MNFSHRQSRPLPITTRWMDVSDQNGEREGGLFPSTRWSVVARLHETEDGKAATALAELCQIYWVPVYCFVRSKGRKHEDAEDLTQGFFAQLLQRETFTKADKDRGQLRSFLIVAIKRHLINCDRHASRLKRGGPKSDSWPTAVKNANQVFQQEPVHGDTPETYFEKRWATTIIETALAKLKGDYEDKSQGELFEAIRPFISLRAHIGDQGKVAGKLGMKIGAFRMAISRLRERYAEALRATVADTLADPSPEAVEEELDYLFALFSR